MNASPRLVMDNISKSFGATMAVKSAHFEVAPGEVHALVGENGAGKSTLMKVLAGVHRPDSGSITLDGSPVEFASPAEAITGGVNTVYQELNLIPELDCAANIALGREPSRALFMHNAIIRERAARVLAEVGAACQPTTLVSSLSTGERQLVEIAKALATDAKVIIMDEPSAALSASDVQRLYEAIRKLIARNISVVYITNKLAEVFAIAHRVSVMRDGRLIATVLTSETNKDDLVVSMIGKNLQSQISGRSRGDARAGAVGQGDSAPRALEVKGLTTSGEVRDVSFSVRPGQILGMAGLVGAGRTEVVRALLGLEKITSGQITLYGRPFNPSSPHASKAVGIAMVPEDRKTQGLLLDQTVEANVSLPHLSASSWFGWVNRGAVRQMAQRCVELFDIRPHRIDALVGMLSGGNQQKVLIGRWMIGDFRVVIFDEPSRGVDVGARAGIWQMVRGAAERGAAVIVVSSETEELIALSDLIVVMRQGRVTACLDNIDLTEEKVMMNAF